MHKLKCLDAFQLKLIMVFLMFLNHLCRIQRIQYFLVPELVSIFTLISRCVAPMFAYLIVEGILYTHNLKKYCLRLFLWAGAMFVGNTLLNNLIKSNLDSLSTSEQRDLFLSDNIFFTFAMGVLCISLIIWGKEKSAETKIGIWMISATCFVIGFLWGEWGTIVMPFIIVTYCFREKKIFRYIGYVIIEIIALLIPYSEPFYFIVFPFIFLYNGKRGLKTKFSKYFFYVFYIVHLWVIYYINFFIIIYYH